MQYDANMPIWLQVMDLISADIVTGKIAPGEKLPGGRDMAIRYSINPNTAARVYSELEKANLVETRRGMGTYVTEDKARIEGLREHFAKQAAQVFIDRMRELGISKEEAARLLAQEEK